MLWSALPRTHHAADNIANMLLGVISLTLAMSCPPGCQGRVWRGRGWEQLDVNLAHMSLLRHCAVDKVLPGDLLGAG